MTNKKGPVETLFQLKKLIDDAVQIISEEWANEEHGVPSSLDDPNVNEFGETQRLSEASKIAIGASGMLQALLRHPKDHLMEMASQYFESRALHAVSIARIPDILHNASLQGKSEGLTTAELSEKTGYDKKKCGRVMRMLTTNHVFKQTGPEQFANNRISAALINNSALSDYIDLYGTEWYASSQHLIEAFKDPSTELGAAAFTKDRLYNKDGNTYWQYNDEHPSRHDMFANAMAGSAQSNIDAILSAYPWEDLGFRASVVDVGGGIGALSLPLLQKYSNLSLVIQDRKTVIDQAREYWNAQFPTAIAESRVAFQVSDFFVSPNKVKGAAVYLLRYIMDDWDDDSCVNILSAIKDAMTSDSRILIVEALLLPSWFSSGEGNSDGIAMAPVPLLPNFGVAQKFIHCRDMNMMNLINGTERTASEMTEVVERAGLKVKKIWVCRGGMFITECIWE